MKNTLALIASAALVAATSLITPALADDDWRLKAVELVQEERKVHEALWSQEESLWVTMDDDGTRHDGFADYLCLVLTTAGRPQGEFVAITVWSHADMQANKLNEIGKFYCR